MQKTSFTIAVACFVLATVIFVFADGARRIYAGAFFVMLGVGVVVNAKRSSRSQE